MQAAVILVSAVLLSGQSLNFPDAADSLDYHITIFHHTNPVIECQEP